MVLIVAECNVNVEYCVAELERRIVLIVAECNVNGTWIAAIIIGLIGFNSSRV